MSEKLFSDAWYRVAEVRPRLRAHARLHRHRYRGDVWYLLQDPVSGRVHRFTPAARLMIAAMDGRRSIDQLWQLANRHLGDNAPTQDETIGLIGQLYGADLLQMDVTPDTAELFERGQSQARAQRRRAYSNPMALRIPLLDPDRFLNRIGGLLRLVWSRWGAMGWLIAVVPALALVPLHWPELTGDLSDRVLAADNLFLLWLLFPVIKALHELGHAAATKAGGGEVHDIGLMLLVLIPVPYVDASAATVFRSKYRRALVGAAGMLVELFIAALAFYLWLLAEPGLVRAIAFNVMLVAGVSTVLFNGNPLLRYDAYYILADLIEMPNLASRSLKYWGYLLERYVFRVSALESPVASRSERAWCLWYGLGSTLYRLFVTVSIALFIAGKYFVIGVLLAIWAVVAMALLPLAKGLRYLATSPRLRRRRSYAITLSGALLAGIAALILLVPLPFRSQAEGVIWLSEPALVRAGDRGFFDRLLVEQGAQVKRGDALAQLSDPDLDLLIRVGAARVAELKAHHSVAFVQDLAQAEIVRQQLEAEQAALARARERAAALTVRARSEGVFMAPVAADLPGRYFHQGDLVGYVLDSQRPIARVAVTQGEVDVVRLATDRVAVRPVHDLEQVVAGRIVRQVPAGEERLPSRVLTTEGGGRISVDPRDAECATALERFFLFDVELEGGVESSLVGERVYVRFEHAMEPLGMQWFRGLRRLFLSRFNV